MNYSYVMGVNTIGPLQKKGFKIKPYGDNYGVTFSDKETHQFEDYISKCLKKGFWNEYLGKETVFIFKFENGKIKKYILNKQNEDEVLNLCKKFANYPFESIDQMLQDNQFYAEVYFHR